MSEIIAKYNTKSKELAVTKDGESLNNVNHVSISRNYDYEKGKDGDTHACHIAMVDKSEEEGYNTHTHLVANEIGDLVERKEKLPAQLGLSYFIKSHLNKRRGN